MVIKMNLKRLYIEITNICNLNCSFCSPVKREKRFMTLNEIEHILKEFNDFKCHIYPHIKGEPLCHPEFYQIVSLFSKYEKPLNITTNGVLISKYTDILLNGARQVNISVHSLLDGQIKETDKYLNDIILFGILAKERKKPNVSYRLWTESENESIRNESMNIIKIISDAFGVDIKKEIKKGRNAIKLSENVYISLMNKFSWPDINDKSIRTSGNCLGAKEMLGILADGTVVPCCLDADGVINLGNIFKESIMDILKSERFLKLNEGFLGGKLSEPLCQKCTFYNSRKGN